MEQSKLGQKMGQTKLGQKMGKTKLGQKMGHTKSGPKNEPKKSVTKCHTSCASVAGDTCGKELFRIVPLCSGVAC